MISMFLNNCRYLPCFRRVGENARKSVRFHSQVRLRDETTHPMSKTTTKETPPPCGSQHCSCRRGPRCRCHDYNALLALARWDFGRMIRRHKNLN